MARRATAGRHVAIGVLAGATGGPATYGRCLVESLGALDEGWRVTVLTDRPDAFAECGAAVVHVPMRGGIDRLRWQHVGVPRALRALDCDVFHDTKNALPKRLRVPGVVTVHDLAYYTRAETFGFLSRLFLKRATADAVRRARRIVVPSQATADDVARFFPQAAERVRVVLHGIDPHPACSAEQRDDVRRRHGLPERFVLHVGTIQGRKNVDLLIGAVRALRARGQPHRVVLAGRRGWLSEDAFAEIERDDTAMWLGEVPGADLPALYELAEAFVSPSAYEGFGLTVADALAAGTPTVISDVSSLPEVCGDAAQRIGELTTDGVAAALDPVLASAELRAELSARGRARAAEFTWRRAAERTARVYGEVL